MLLLPAHTKDAKEMARRLCDALQIHGLTADCRNPEAEFLTLQQTQELLAKAMGHPSWRQMAAALKEPHRTIYIDGGSEDALTAFATQLSGLLGFDYAHGSVLRAIHTSGAGFSPKFRRAMEDNDSPWGPIVEQEEIAPGIVSVTTGGHGGLVLSPERQAAMPVHLRIDGAGYEEDGEYNLVVLAFPEEQDRLGNLRDALAYLNIIDHSKARQDHSRTVSALLNSGQDIRTLTFPTFEEPPLPEMETRVVAYLAECVRTNRMPIRFPDEAKGEVKNVIHYARSIYHQTLQQWVDVLSTVPTVEGRWATRPGPWFDHWGWRARDAQRFEAHEAMQEELLKNWRERPPEM